MPSTPIISNVKLQMEKKKLTKNHVFHLSKILIGVSVMDAFLLAYHHKVINTSNFCMGKQKLSIQMFTGILSHQLTHRQDTSVKGHHDSTQILLWTLGVNVMNAFLLAYHHQVINISSLGMGKQKISIQMFNGILSHQLTHRQDASVKVHHDSTQILLWTLFPFFVTKIPQRVVYQTILLTLSRNRRDKKSVT